MSDISIRIKAILESSSKAQLEAELKKIEQKLKPLELKTNIDKASRSYKTLEDGSRRLAEHSRSFTNSLGEQVTVTRRLNDETGKFVTTSVTKLTQEKKVTDQLHKQSIAQEKMLNTIRGMRGKDGAFIQGENLTNLNKLEASIRSLDPASKTFTSDMRNHNLELQKINTSTGIYKKEVQDATKHTGLFGQSLFEAGKKFAGWLFMGNIIMQTIRFVKTGIETVKELDYEVIGLKKVTYNTRVEYEAFAVSAGELATSLGKTTQEVIRSATEFARLGYNLQQSAALAKEALILSNVGLMPIEQSTRHLISTVKAFSIEIDEQGRNVREVVDLINDTGNRFAITQEGIGEALRRSSASMRSSGNTLQETIAIIAATNEIIQDPSVVGTALKTVSMRLRGVSEDGEDVVDMLPTLEAKFRAVGITLREDEDTFKSTTQIMREMANVWDDITDMQRADLLEAVAGKRQGQIIAGLMTNFEQVENALNFMETASGSALTEFTKYMESLEYKSERLRNTVIQIWSGGFDAKILKDITDGLTVLASGVSIVTDKFGILPTVIGIIIISATMLSAKFRTLSTSFRTSIIDMGRTAYSAIFLGNAMSALALKVNLATIATRLWQSAMTLGIALALGVVIDKLMGSFSGLADRVSQTTGQQLEFLEANKITADNIDDLVRRLEFANLSYEDQLDIQKRLAQILPEATTGYTDQGVAIADNIELIKTLNAEKRRELQLEAYRVMASLGDDKNLAKQIQEVKDIRTEIEKLDQEIADIRSGKRAKFLSQEDNDAFTNNLFIIRENLADLETQAISSAKTLNQALSVLNELGLGNFKTFKNIYEQFSKATDDSTKTTEENTRAVSENIKTVEQAKTAIFNLTDSFENLAKAEKELNDTGYVSEEILSMLVSKYGDKLDATNLNSDAIRTLIDNQKEYYYSTIEDSIKATEQVIEDTKSRIKAYIAEMTALRAMSTWSSDAGIGESIIRKPLTDLDRELNEQLSALSYLEYSLESYRSRYSSGTGLSSSSVKDTSKSFNLYESSLKRINDELSILKDKLESDPSLQAEINLKLNFKKDLIEREKEEVGNALKEAYRELESINKDYADRIRRGDDVSDLVIINNEALANAIDNVLKLKSAYGDLEKSLHDVGKEFKSLYESLIKIQKDMDKTILDGYANELDAFKKAREAIIEGYQAQIDLLEEKADLEDESIERQRRIMEIEKAQQRLTNTLNERNTRIFVEGVGWTWQANPQDVRNAQDDLKNLQEDYADWERKNTVSHQKKMLQDQIKHERDSIAQKQKWFDNLKTQFEDSWKNMEMLSDNYLSLFGDNLDAAVSALLNKMGILNGELKGMIPDKSANSSSGSSGSSGGLYTGGASNEDYYTDAGKQAKETGNVGGGVTKESYLATPNIWTDEEKAYYDKAFGFAKGTTSAPGGLSMVGEEGAELRVLNKGDGIIPSQITKNLMALGQSNIMDRMMNLIKTPSFTPSFAGMGGNSSSESFNIYGNITVVSNNPKELINQLRNISAVKR